MNHGSSGSLTAYDSPSRWDAEEFEELLGFGNNDERSLGDLVLSSAFRIRKNRGTQEPSGEAAAGTTTSSEFDVMVG
jgi:hypothetical protein